MLLCFNRIYQLIHLFTYIINLNDIELLLEQINVITPQILMYIYIVKKIVRRNNIMSIQMK